MKRKKEEYLMGAITPLSKLRVGQKGKVISINVDDKVLRRKLFDMGITNGVEIEIIRVAPLGDPIDVRLRGYDLCLRKEDMFLLSVEVVS